MGNEEVAGQESKGAGWRYIVVGFLQHETLGNIIRSFLCSLNPCFSKSRPAQNKRIKLVIRRSFPKA